MTLASLPARHRQGQARCEATTGVRVTDYGLEPLRCHARVGLRFYEAPDGSRHAFCSKHRERVIGQVRRGA